MTTRLYVGSYGERGLHRLNLATDGTLAIGPSSGIAANASYGALSSTHGLLYLVDEREDGAIGVFRPIDDGWERLAEVPTHGALPCFLSLSPDERTLAVANYGDGSCTAIALDPDSGLPAQRGTVRRNQGHGPVADRQDGPHAHCAVFSKDGRWLYQTDLGTDEIRAFRVDAERGTLGEGATAWRAKPGSGPRHVVLHPAEPLAFLVSELASTLTVLEVAEGRFLERETVSTLPADFEGESLGGHLAFDSTTSRLFVTNRGHDSIAAFACDDGGLRLLGHSPAGGKSPRFVLILEPDGVMLVANEEGGGVTAFHVRDDGMLIRCGEASVAKPAFIFRAPHD